MGVNGLIFYSNLFLFYRSVGREFNFTVDFHVKLMSENISFIIDDAIQKPACMR